MLLELDDIKQLVGEFFNGQYEVKKFLGEGSFAKVYLVKHNYLEDLRAMKIIKEPVSPATNIKSVFKEVMLATKLRHENIISIYDAGIMSTFGQNKKDLAFFVMEYVQGGDLEQYLNSFINSNILMPINKVLTLIRQILMGLNTLHMSNPPIIHRDLKLKNILLTFDNCGEIVVKISDFGFSKEVTTKISDIDIVGTRPYMAPECFKKTISTMTDIYAVGVIFYQLLTNKFPCDMDMFSMEDLLELKPWKEQFKPPSYHNKNVSTNIDEIVMKCLQINPKDRYQNASELLADIEIVINNLEPAVDMTNRTEAIEDDYHYLINNSLRNAFRLAKRENGLDMAIEILENEFLNDYEIRKHYGETLKMWKSPNPDVKLISKAFTVNLSGKNYYLSIDLLKEAIAYNPSIKNKFSHYIDLWKIFIELSKDANLIKAVLSLEELMEKNKHIKQMYSPIINTLKTYSVEEIVAQSNHLVNLNNLIDASNLMEFAVVFDSDIRDSYEYKLSLWKQNMNHEFKISNKFKGNTIDYAIDLGTTDSILSYYNDGNPIIVKNYLTGDDFTPSAVLIDEDNNIHVGEDAKNALWVDDKNAISEFKHNMGFSIPFNFQKSSRIMQPEELSAEILKDLRTSAYKQLGVNVEHAVICVPANSNYIKTKAINDAADLAGLRSHSLLLEPVAVSIAYDLKENNWLIYDLGGGTFSISLIRYFSGEIDSLDSIRLDDFGGNAFDWAIVDDIFAPKIAKQLKLKDFTRDNKRYKRIFSKLKVVAENSKKELSKYSSADIFIHNLFNDYDFTYTLTRDMLVEIIEPLIKPTFNLVQKLLNDNSLSSSDIDKVILVGGSCVSPIVQDLINENLDMSLEHGINPLTVVAKGASIYAGMLKKPNVDISSNPFSLILNIQKDYVSGRVFTIDDKYSFLGYYVEFIGDEYSTGKVPINLDGTFKVLIRQGDYEIVIYDHNSKVEIDERSPILVKNDKMFIKFFDNAFSSDGANISQMYILDKYSSLIKSIDYLNEYSCSIRGIEIIDYIDRLIELVKIDKRAMQLASIYLDYLENMIKREKFNLNFSMLLENVKNKLDIAKRGELFETADFNRYLDIAVNTNDFVKLDEIYNNLIREYVKLNKDDVIISSFFNLKTEGIYDKNRQDYEDLSKRASIALDCHDYDDLAVIVRELYEIDERFDR